MKLNDSTVRKMAMPGKNATHQAEPRYSLPFEMSARHEGVAPCEGYEDTADHACPACCSSSHSSGAESRDASRASAESSDAESGTPRS